jgi:dTDP-4-amino-4,6-dideoxygalactose transaminase
MRPHVPSFSAAATRLLAVEESGQYANFGPQERELRDRFAQRLQVRPEQIATVSNATLGIAGAVSVLGGRRWLVPSFTFAATPAAVLTAGCEVVFGDIGEGWVLDAEGEEADGFVPVAPFGAAPNIARWVESGRVVHDAAASLGNDLDLATLPAGQAAVFSLHATKVLGAGEGGIVVFGDESDATRFRAWTNFGFSGSREAQVPGLNAKMSEIAACFVHAALDGWEQERAEWVSARAQVVAMAGQFGVRLFGPSQDGINPYAIVVFDDEQTTLEVERVLEVRGIGTRRWWAYGCHRMPAYAHLATREFPVTHRVARASLGLPFFQGMTNGDIETVAEGLAEALASEVAPD